MIPKYDNDHSVFNSQRIAVINIIPLKFYGLHYDISNMINCLPPKLDDIANHMDHRVLLVCYNILLNGSHHRYKIQVFFYRTYNVQSFLC